MRPSHVLFLFALVAVAFAAQKGEMDFLKKKHSLSQISKTSSS